MTEVSNARKGNRVGPNKPEFSRQDDGPVIPIIPTQKEAEPFGNVALCHGDMATSDGKVRYHFAERDLRK